MPQLDPTWFASQIFWLSVSFVVLYVLIRSAVLPRLIAVVEKRTASRAQNLSAAELLQKEAEEARQQYERTLSEARERARQAFAEAEQRFKQLSESSHKHMDAKLAERAAQAQQGLQEKQQQLKAHLEESAKALAAGIVEKFTGHTPELKQAAAALGQVRGGA